MNSLTKLYEKGLSIRLQKHLEIRGGIDILQGNGHQKQGVAEVQQSLTEIINHAETQNISLIITACDLSKCYDRIPRTKLWAELIKVGIKGKLLKAIQSTYEN